MKLHFHNRILMVSRPLPYKIFLAILFTNCWVSLTIPLGMSINFYEKSKLDKKIVILVGSYIAIIAAFNIFSMKHLSLTTDERFFYSYGQSIIRLNSNRDKPMSDSKMPFSVLNVLPRFLGEHLKAGKTKNYLIKLETGRIATVLLALILGLFVFLWSYKLYGHLGGIISLTLYAFSPNILAHSRLITSDLYAACLITVALYYFWRFLENPSLLGLILSAVTLGIAQLTKYSCLFLYPILTIIFIIRYWPKVCDLTIHRDIRKSFKSFSKLVLICAFFLMISILIINIGFLFNNSGVPFADYSFKTPALKHLQSESKLLGKIRIPFPYPYLQGIDITLYRIRIQPYSRGYLLGRLAKPHQGFRGYYLFAYALKVPIAIQIFVIAAVLNFIIRRKNYFFSRNESFLLVPVLFYSIYMNFFVPRNIGFRHVLMIMPLLFIFCGNLFSEKSWKTLKVYQKAFTLFLILYLIISSLSYFPHYLSYFNEIVWDRKTSYQYLVDSNLDWGQNQYYWTEYKKKHPDAILNPPKPISGRIVVTANELVGIFKPEKYKWLRDNFRPVGHIAYSYLIFNVSEEKLKNLQIK